MSRLKRGAGDVRSSRPSPSARTAQNAASVAVAKLATHRDGQSKSHPVRSRRGRGSVYNIATVDKSKRSAGVFRAGSFFKKGRAGGALPAVAQSRVECSCAGVSKQASPGPIFETLVEQVPLREASSPVGLFARAVARDTHLSLSLLVGRHSCRSLTRGAGTPVSGRGNANLPDECTAGGLHPV